MSKTLSDLARELYQAKQAEAEAKAKRIEIEEGIAALVPIDGDRGSKTADAGDGLKVTVKRGMNYKADVEGIRGIEADELPVKHVPASWKFDEAAYEKIRESKPDLAAKLAPFVTATPAKVAVELKLA